MADLKTIKGSGRWLAGDALFSDTIDLAEAPRGIYVGVSGDVKMNDDRGTTIVFKSMPIGFYPFHPRRIFATLTTATNLVLLY